MKKIFLLIVLSIASGTIIMAQDTLSITIDSSNTERSFSENMALMIEPLDKSQITTGILADKAFILSSMNEFDGLMDTSIITLSRWRQIYRQLYTATITDSLLISPDSLMKMVENDMQQNRIPLVIANIKYNELKTFVLDSNLLQYSDGKLYDVQGRIQSPYNENRFFSIVPFNGQIYQGQFNFMFDNNLIITNTDDTIISIEIDFDDGLGFVNINTSNNNAENIRTVNYITTGRKTIAAKVTFSNNNILLSKSSLNIVSTSSVVPDNSFYIAGYTNYPDDGYYGYTGTGTAYVLYGCGNNNQLRKPIIVSDGFDPKNERHFYDYLDNNGSVQMGLYSLLNQENFIEKARAEGFDFVILDYHAGADDIQRNAQVLISLIMNVNSQLAANGSTSQLVVVGPSMAGLISKYALRYMEINNLNHNTRLYISFDSPHQGANIPLGDQLWLDFFAKYAGAQGAIDGRAILNTTAAKQMLEYHYTTFPYLNSLRLTLFHPYFGYPTKCRKIAIANGSGNNTTFFSPCEQLIDYSYSVSPIGNVARGHTFAVPAPLSGQCRIFEGKLPTYFLLGIPIVYTTQTVKVSNTQPYDSAPGGSNNVNEEIANGDTQGKGDIFTNFPNSCFIPTASALALNTGINFNIIGQSYYPYAPYPISINTSPFDGFFAPTYNQKHVTITDENIGWIMSEVSPVDLYLQNRTIDNANYESRNTITIGKNVDPVLNRQQVGDFITTSGSNVNIHAGQEIILKPGTVFKANSNAHLYIEDFSCPSVLRMGNVINENDSTPNEIFSETTNDIKAPQSNSNFAIYPNPNKGQFTIELNNTATESTIEIYDLMGKKVWSKISPENKLEIDISNQPKGIYLVKVVNETKVTVQKIVYD